MKQQMKEYIAPLYNCEAVEINDIILSSVTDAALLTEISKTEAKVSASVLTILGLR